MNGSRHSSVGTARSALLLAALAFAASGCASDPKVNSLGPEEERRENGEPRSAGLDEAIRLLGEGEPQKAQMFLEGFLEKNPGHPRALNLKRQIEDDPVLLLGESFQTYKVQPGDTMSELAETFAGDSFLFYALSRYNGLLSPKSLSEGAVIQVPATMAASPQKPDLRTAIAATPASDLALASELRRNALKMLNSGNVEGAVGELRQAHALAPADPIIEADLLRAERLFNAVRIRDN